MLGKTPIISIDNKKLKVGRLSLIKISKQLERSWLGQIRDKTEHCEEPYYNMVNEQAEVLTKKLGKSVLAVV